MLIKSDPVTKHIEYIGHYDSSIISGWCPKAPSVGLRRLRFVGKRHSGVWTKGSQITTLGRRRGRGRLVIANRVGQESHISSVFPHNADSHVRGCAGGRS